jgi:hypothetical protein
MNLLRWLKYLVKCLAAIGDGLEIVIERWPTDYPTSSPIKAEKPASVANTGKGIAV